MPRGCVVACDEMKILYYSHTMNLVQRLYMAQRQFSSPVLCALDALAWKFLEHFLASYFSRNILHILSNSSLVLSVLSDFAYMSSSLTEQLSHLTNLLPSMFWWMLIAYSKAPRLAIHIQIACLEIFEDLLKNWLGHVLQSLHNIRTHFSEVFYETLTLVFPMLPIFSHFSNYNICKIHNHLCFDGFSTPCYIIPISWEVGRMLVKVVKLKFTPTNCICLNVSRVD